MNSNCQYSGCNEKAQWECTCKDKLKFCDYHVKIHVKKRQCNSKRIDEDYNLLLEKIQDADNALDELELAIIETSETMKNEINECLKDDLNYIQEKRLKLHNSTKDSHDNYFENLIEWANDLSNKDQNKSNFRKIVQNLLNIRDNHISKSQEISKFKTDLTGNRKDIENVIETIQKLKGVYESYDNEIYLKGNKKNYEESKIISDSIYRGKINIRIITRYK